MSIACRIPTRVGFICKSYSHPSKPKIIVSNQVFIILSVQMQSTNIGSFLPEAMLLRNTATTHYLIWLPRQQLESYQKIKFSGRKGRGCVNPLPASDLIHKTVKSSWIYDFVCEYGIIPSCNFFFRADVYSWTCWRAWCYPSAACLFGDHLQVLQDRNHALL